MSADKDILTKEIEPWTGFEYALRKENRTLFVDCAAAKGESFSTAALVLVLIFEQQKMINELIRKLGKADRI